MNVLVTTEYRGVFFGELISRDDDKRVVSLKDAKNCVSWSSSVKGFMGLASTGPDGNCRIGPTVPQLDLIGVTSITTCTDTASDAWRSQPWS